MHNQRVLYSLLCLISGRTVTVALQEIRVDGLWSGPGATVPFIQITIYCALKVVHIFFFTYLRMYSVIIFLYQKIPQIFYYCITTLLASNIFLNTLTNLGNLSVLNVGSRVAFLSVNKQLCFTLRELTRVFDTSSEAS